MSADGRRGWVGIDRRWLTDPALDDSALRLMLWLDSHTDTFLASVNYTRAAEMLGWGRNRVKRAAASLERLGLVTTEQIDRDGGGTVTAFVLHQSAWSDRDGGPSQTTAPRHGDAPPVVHGDAPTTRSTRSGKQNLGASDDGRHAAGVLCIQLADLIEQTGARRPVVSQRWLTDMDRLIRLDDHSSADVERVLRWLHSGRDEVAQFWWPNVRSPGKLREKWDQMAAQVARSSMARATGSGTSTIDRIRQANNGATT